MPTNYFTVEWDGIKGQDDIAKEIVSHMGDGSLDILQLVYQLYLLSHPKLQEEMVKMFSKIKVSC